MKLKSPIFLRFCLLAAGVSCFLAFHDAEAQEYGENFYRNHANGAVPPPNLRTPAVQGSRQVHGVIVESNRRTRRIAVRDSQNRVYWVTVPANREFGQLLRSGRVWVKLNGFRAVDIVAG